MTVTFVVSEWCRRLLCAAAAAGLLSSLAPDAVQVAAADAPQAKAHTVLIEGTSFHPERLTVAAGDTVVWINRDPFPHTATSTSGAFDSGSIAPDKSWTFKPLKKGDLDYICSLHPTMKARLTVE